MSETGIVVLLEPLRIISVGIQGPSGPPGDPSSMAEINNTGTTQTVNWAAGQYQKTTITAATDVTFIAPTGPRALTLKIINGGLGAITWPSTVKWPGGTEPSWTATGTDVTKFYFDGTEYYGTAQLAFA